MTICHLVIASERRQVNAEDTRPLAVSMTSNMAADPENDPPELVTQLHMQCEAIPILANPFFRYVSVLTEGGKVEVLKNEVGAINMTYSGWPEYPEGAPK